VRRISKQRLRGMIMHEHNLRILKELRIERGRIRKREKK